MEPFSARIGDVPVIYNEEEAQRSQEEIAKAVHNMGYMAATVERSTKIKKKKIKQYFDVTVGKPYTVNSVKYDIQDAKIAGLFKTGFGEQPAEKRDESGRERLG